MGKTFEWLHWLGSSGAHPNYEEKCDEWQLIDMDSASYVCSGNPGIIDFDNGLPNCKRVAPPFSNGWRVSQCHDRSHKEETPTALAQ